MNDVKWIRICTGLFDDEKILLIEAMEHADAIIIIWLKLLCMAGKQNNAGVFEMCENMPYTAEMLATIFKRPLAVVKEALSVFENFGMIKTTPGGVITVPNWAKHQNEDALEKIREDTRNRVKKYRERQKKAKESEPPEDEKDASADCNVTVTLRNALRKEKNRVEENIFNTPRACAREKEQIRERVFLYPEERDKLISEYGEQGLQEIADILDAHKLKTGAEYASDYGAIRDWVIERYERKRKSAPKRKEAPRKPSKKEIDEEEQRSVMRLREIMERKKREQEALNG